MTSVVRLEYPDLSTELVKSELSFAGDSLDITGQDDQRAFVEVEAGDAPVTITTGSLDDTIVGGSGNDIISGGAGSDNIDGGPGNDNIQGGDGDDVLAIGPGDTVSSGGGTDILQFDLAQEYDAENLPTIEDFAPGEDRIAILGDENPTATPVYDSNTGSLIVDGEEIVQLKPDLKLTSADVTIGGTVGGTSVTPDPTPITIDSSETTVFRFFNPSKGGHFYTADVNERDSVRDNLDNYIYEGETYETATPTAVAQSITGEETVEAEEVYRFFNPSTGVHLYTTDENERDSIIENLDNFVYENVKFYAYETEVEGSLPVYRFYEPTLGVHFYTPDLNERNSVLENLDNYVDEGIAYYAMPLDAEM